MIRIQRSYNSIKVNKCAFSYSECAKGYSELDTGRSRRVEIKSLKKVTFLQFQLLEKNKIKMADELN